MAGSATKQTPGVGALDDRDIRLSAGARRAETTPIGFAFYNIGLQNEQVGAKRWRQNVWELQSDVVRIVSKSNVHDIFLCEFGNMLHGIEHKLYQMQADKPSKTPRTEVVQEFFNTMLARIGLTTWKAYPDAPYVALVDVSIWEVKVHERIQDMCSHQKQRAQHLLLEHCLSERLVRVLDEGQGKDWYNSRPLDDWLMEEAVTTWKQDFEATDLINKEQVEALRALDTRVSKKRANEVVNGAWKTHLAKSCGRSQEELTPEISEEKRKQEELKMRLFRLRNLRRLMNKYSRVLRRGEFETCLNNTTSCSNDMSRGTPTRSSMRSQRSMATDCCGLGRSTWGHSA